MRVASEKASAVPMRNTGLFSASNKVSARDRLLMTRIFWNREMTVLGGETLNNPKVSNVSKVGVLKHLGALEASLNLDLEELIS